jgi:hypothetical protein
MERWASAKKRKPTSMFGLVQVKWFGFISKQPNQLHPQLVHWWVLGHSSLELESKNCFLSTHYPPLVVCS